MMEINDVIIKQKKNKFGNISELSIIESYDVKDNIKPQFVTNFYFRLEKECGMSNGDYPVFCKIKLEHGSHIEDPQAIIQLEIAKIGQKCGFETMGECRKHIISISKYEYEKEMKLTEEE